jgi:hypothetical protein
MKNLLNITLKDISVGGRQIGTVTVNVENEMSPQDMQEMLHRAKEFPSILNNFSQVVRSEFVEWVKTIDKVYENKMSHDISDMEHEAKVRETANKLGLKHFRFSTHWVDHCCE